VADGPLKQPVDQRERRHGRHVDEQPSAGVQEGVQPQQEEVGRHQVLQEVRAEDGVEAATEVRQAILDVRERHVEAERPTEVNITLDGVDTGTTGPEVHEMLAVRAADVEDRPLVQSVCVAHEANRPGRDEEVAEQALGFVRRQRGPGPDEACNLFGSSHTAV